jgi:hypothetical protein
MSMVAIFMEIVLHTQTPLILFYQSSRDVELYARINAAKLSDMI